MQELIIAICGVAGVAVAAAVRRRRDPAGLEQRVLARSISILEKDDASTGQHVLLHRYKERLKDIRAGAAPGYDVPAADAGRPTVAHVVQPTVPPEAQPEVPPEVQPETPVKVPPEVPSDMPPAAPEAMPEAPPEVHLAVPPKTQHEISTKVSPAVPPEVQPAVQPEAPAEVQPAVQPEAPAEVPPAVPSEIASAQQSGDTTGADVRTSRLHPGAGGAKDAKRAGDTGPDGPLQPTNNTDAIQIDPKPSKNDIFDFDDDAEDLEKLKADIIKTLSKLDTADKD